MKKRDKLVPYCNIRISAGLPDTLNEDIHSFPQILEENKVAVTSNTRGLASSIPLTIQSTDHCPVSFDVIQYLYVETSLLNRPRDKEIFVPQKISILQNASKQSYHMCISHYY
jgi:hypothetical protein